MKKVLFAVSALAIAGLAFAFMPKDSSSTPTGIVKPGEGESAIHWLTWDEAIKANEKTKKKFFIDFYTDWCGWCKRMDKTTFTDPGVVKFVNENFHPVKFNAEQKEEVEFQGKTFKWVAGGRHGVHTLAYELLDGRLGYPSYVYLTPEYERILISPGYKPAPDMQKELDFVAGDYYNTTTWEKFRKK